MSCAISQGQYSIYMIMILVHLCKMISPGVFFHCFEIFTFWAASEVKRQEIAQNEEQQLHQSCAISQEQYRI